MCVFKRNRKWLFFFFNSSIEAELIYKELYMFNVFDEFGHIQTPVTPSLQSG